MVAKHELTRIAQVIPKHDVNSVEASYNLIPEFTPELAFTLIPDHELTCFDFDSITIQNFLVHVKYCSLKVEASCYFSESYSGKHAFRNLSALNTDEFWSSGLVKLA